MECGRRILLWSQRELNNAPSRCVGYEFEDVILQIEPDTTFVAPEHSRWSPTAHRIADRFTRDTGRRFPISPGYRMPEVCGDFELFFALVQFPNDLYSLPPVDRRARARRSVCVIEEIWAHDIPKWKGLRSLLSGFDHVFVECMGSVASLQEAIGVPCSYLPPAVDALRFCPYPASPARVVDVCQFGRRRELTHYVLLDAYKLGDIYYEFDSVRPEHVWNTSEHRDHLAGVLKRSRYAIVNPGKFNSSAETNGQQELGFRFFEGAAAGAVMLGSRPETAAFDENFGWRDAVIDVDVALPLDAIAELDHDPARLAAIRHDNVANCLLRHDWVYRWEAVLKVADLASSASAELRKRALANLASSVVSELSIS